MRVVRVLTSSRRRPGQSRHAALNFFPHKHEISHLAWTRRAATRYLEPRYVEPRYVEHTRRLHSFEWLCHILLGEHFLVVSVDGVRHAAVVVYRNRHSNVVPAAVGKVGETVHVKAVVLVSVQP